MISVENRKSERKSCCVQAFVTNVEDTFEIKCTIRDVSEKGCKLVSSRIAELSDDLHLYPEGFDKPIVGRVAWRTQKMAGISFLDHSKHSTARCGRRADQPIQDATGDVILELGTEKETLGYAGRLRRMRGNR